MIFKSPVEIFFKDLFLNISLENHFKVNLKLEGFSLTGSIKVKPALYMIESLEKQGKIRKGSEIIESSSGNLGLALSMICAVKGYKFTCISDINIAPLSEKIIKAYGANLIIVDQKDENGGFLQTRINLIKNMLQENSNLVWINQYENEDNINTHYNLTGAEILNEFPHPDYLFVGAGTTGTLGGVSRLFREKSPQTKIIAVDSVGSVTFGQPAGKRFIPGLGTSSAPPISRFSSYDHLLMIPEIETIHMCQEMAKKGILLGGSSGTVLCGIRKYASFIPENSCVVALSPDLGDRYVDTIYSDEWVSKNYPNQVDNQQQEIEQYAYA